MPRGPPKRGDIIFRMGDYIRTIFLWILIGILILKGTEFRNINTTYIPSSPPDVALALLYDAAAAAADARVPTKVNMEPSSRPHTTAKIIVPRDVAVDNAMSSPPDPTIRTDDTSTAKDGSVNFSLLLEHVLQERRNLRQKLVSLYGEYYEDIFEPSIILDKRTQQQQQHRVSIGKHTMYKSPSHLPNENPDDTQKRKAGMLTGTPGWDRMVRKLQIKILQAQSSELLSSSRKTTTTTTFRWMTSGNGPASGSGNMFHETSTSILEASVKPIFAAVNINFQAQNYAIQALSSGDEAALCANELYGHDYDVLFWDFGMTDESDVWKLAMFAYRAILLPSHSSSKDRGGGQTRPALVASLVGGLAKQYATVLSGLEKRGMTVLGRDVSVHRKQELACPDSLGKSKAEREAMPRHLQYIRCGKEMEEGGPKTYDNVVDGKKMCRNFQFNNAVCPNRFHKNIWHPGWKVSALDGYTLTMTLQELLIEALEGLVHKQKQQPNKDISHWMEYYLNKLNRAEQADYEQSLEAPGLPELDEWYSNEEKQDIHSEIDLSSLFRRPSLCRTALLPSKSRSLQAEDIAEKLKLELHTNPYNQSFERGVMSRTLNKFEKRTNKNDGGYRYPEKERQSEMIIITDIADYQGTDNETCSENRLAINHMDAFIITSSQGWRSMTFPSKPELRHNPQFGMEQAKGWLFLRLTTLLNDCPDENLYNRIYQKPFQRDQDPDAMLRQYGHFELTVNAVPVTNFNKLIVNKKGHLDNSLALAHNGTNPYVWKPNADGQYLLKARIVEASDWSYVKISSFIVM